MHNLRILSGSTLLALFASGAHSVVTITTTSTITVCPATTLPPLCSAITGVGASEWSSLLSAGASVIGSGSGGSGGSGGGSSGGSGGSGITTSVAPPYTYTSGWNTTKPVNTTTATTGTGTSTGSGSSTGSTTSIGSSTTSTGISTISTGSSTSTSSSTTTSTTTTSTGISTISTGSSTSTGSSSTTSTSTTSSVSAPACTDYWLGAINHQGLAPYAAAGYQVFRNVMDYGAVGDGVTDDTDAINLAISEGGRCAPGTCSSTTTTPAVVYFPPGTYLVSSPIIDYYYTQIIGNPGCMPVIKVSSSFTSRWVIDGDEYQASGNLGWGSTNVFWRQIRNFVIDMTDVSSNLLVAGIHWPTAQATSLQNLVVRMSEAAGNQHQGLFIESGSAGFVTDLIFYGGAQGISVGNQQFTMRNLTFYNSVTAIQQLWDWGWTYQSLSINNCSVGLDMSAVDSGQLNVGGVVVLDSEINDTPVGILFGNSAATGPPAANNIALENIALNNVDVAIEGPGSTTVLAGSAGQTTIAAWARGNSYTPTGPTAIQGPITPNSRPAGLVDSTGSYYQRSKPQYEDLPASQFVSMRSAGAAGDGTTDDTAAINAALALAVAEGKVAFFDFGVYVVTSTIVVPPGSKIVGESFAVILSSGAAFADMAAPLPVVQVGAPGQTGQVEWSDMIVSSRGAQAGAILIEWNLASPSGAPSGMWDVHTRVGGFTGSDLQVAECPTTPDVVVTSANLSTDCIAAFMSMHVTASASGLYVMGTWLWTADHDVDNPNLTQITVYAGRGLLVESTAGSIWLVGTAVEHHTLYQYQLSGTQAVEMGQAQTETPYYQPNPDARIPFPANAAYNDPVMAAGQSGWGLRVVDSSDVFVYGAGLYSFFDNYNVTCSAQGGGENCQAAVFTVEDSSPVSVYDLNTVGVTDMITYNGAAVAVFSDNLDGFSDSIALFRS